MQERAKTYKSEQSQISSDEEIFDKAKINTNKFDSLTLVKITDAIITLGEALSETKLYPYEREFAFRVIWSLVVGDGETITAEWARQSGKSHTCGQVIIPSTSIMLPLLAEYVDKMGIKTNLLKFKNGLWTGVYGPDYERAGIIGKKIDLTLNTTSSLQILSDPEIGMEFPEKLSSYMGNLPRNSHIKIKSANKAVSIEGDTHHIVFTDETQEVNSTVLTKSISPMLASTFGTTVHIGSAYSKRVYFYDICKKNKEKDTLTTKKKKCHYSFDYRTVEKYNPNYKKYIKKEKTKLGENSDEFRMSYELYWPLEKGMFITEDYLTSRLGKDYYVTNFDKINDHVIGIDIGKQHDSTVVTVIEVDYEKPIVIDPDSGIIRYQKKIKNWIEFQGSNYDEQYYMICDFIDNYKWSVMVTDATGVGSGMFDRLEAKYAVKGKTCIPFVFTRPDKSYGYSLLYKELIQERIEFPNSKKAQALKKQRRFIEQLSNLSKSIEGGYLVVHHEKDTGLDDYADSLMLAVYGVEEKIVEDVEDTIDNIYKVREHSRFANNSTRTVVRNEKNFWTNN